MNFFNQNDGWKEIRKIIKNDSSEKDKTIHNFAEEYFRLFVQDWAENHNLSSTSQLELVEILKDFFCFIEQFSEHHNLDSNSQETLVEILKDSFFFIQNCLDDKQD